MATNERIYRIVINGIQESITQMDVLLSKLNDLDKRLGEITKQGVKIKIGKGDVDIDNSQLDENVKTLAKMRKELGQLKRELANTELGTEQWNKLRDRVLATNNEVKAIEQSYGVFTRNVGNYTNSFLAAFDKFPSSVKETLNGLKSFNSEAATLNQQIKSVSKSMEELVAQGKSESEAYSALAQVLGELNEKQIAFNESVDDAKDRTGGIKDIAEVFNDATGVMQVAAGAMSMFGSESEDAVKSIKKLQEIQTIANGMKQLSTSIQKSGTLWKVWQASLSAADKVLALLPARFRAVAAAEAATAAGAKATTAAMVGLRTAIASTGIGLLVIAVGALVGKLTEMGSAVDDATDKLDEMNDFISNQLQDSLDKIDFQKSIGDLSELDAAKQSLQAITASMSEYEGEWKEFSQNLNTDWELFDKFIKGFKFDFNTREANEEVLRMERTMKKGFNTIEEGQKVIEQTRKAILTLGMDGSKEADAAKKYFEEYLQYSERKLQAMQRQQQAQKELTRLTEQNNIEAISNPYLRERARRESARQEALKAAGDDAEAIAGINARYNREDADAYKALLDEKTRLFAEYQANQLKSQHETLQARLAQLDEEEKAEIASTRKRAQDALVSARQTEEYVKAIQARYRFEREQTELEWNHKMNQTIINLRKELYSELNKYKFTEINLAEQLFNSEELDRRFNYYKNELITHIGSMAKLSAQGIGIPALGENGYDPTKEWEKPDDFAKEWSETLLNTLNYTQEEVDDIMEHIANSMNDRLIHAGVDTSDIANITDTNEKVNALVDKIYNNKSKLEESRNDLENYAESIVGSITLISNGLYDVNKEYPELIREVDDYLKKSEDRYKEHYKKTLEMRQQNLIDEHDLAMQTLENERNMRIDEVNMAEGTEEEKANQILKIEKIYNTKMREEESSHQAKMLQLENDYTEKVESLVTSRYNQLLGMYSDYSSEIQLRVMQTQKHSENEWNIVKPRTIKRALRQAISEYESFEEDFKKFIKQLDEDLSNGQISIEEYNSIYKSITEQAKNSKDSMDDLRQELKEVNGDFISSINTYVSAALNGVTQVADAVFDKQSDALDRQMDKLQDENERLQDILEKQEEIVQQHTSNIDEIEGELATARGDRRDQLVEALNEEKLARERAYAEEKKIEKQKEANERKQRDLEYRQKLQQHKQQMLQAAVSTALAVTNALASQPFVPVGIAMGSLAASLGATQIAIMAANKPKRYKKGGLLEGKSHEQGGIKVAGFGNPIELEGKEYVINKRTTQYNLPLLEFINHSKKRIDVADLIEFYYSSHSNANGGSKGKYADGGQLPTPQVVDIGNNQTHIFVSMDDTPIVVSVEEIVDKTEHLNQVKVLAGAE